MFRSIGAAVLLLGAVVGTASAQLECTADGITVQKNPENCFKASAATFKFSATPDEASHQLTVVAWNIDKTASWAASADLDGVSPSVYNGKIGGNAGEVFAFVWTVNVGAGEHTITLPAAHSTGVLVLADYAFPKAALKAGESVTLNVFQFMATGTNYHVAIDHAFSQEKYIVQQMVVNHGADVDLVLNNAAATASTAEGATTFADVNTVTGDVNVALARDVNAVESSSWTNPFFVVTITLTSVTEYPTLGSEWTTVEVSGTKVFQVLRTSFWTNFTVVSSWSAGYDGAGSPAGGLIQIGDSGSVVSENTGFANTNRVLNSDFDVSGNPAGFVRYLSSADTAKPGRFFVRVKDPSSALFPAPTTVYLKADLQNLGGECATGYASCTALEDDHPSSKKSSSANGEASRMRQCAVLPDSSNIGKPTTRCIECTSDCDCGTGQYCHSNDYGVCRREGTDYFVCDGDSYLKFGLCIDKDPGETILGKSCRTNSGATASAGIQIAQVSPSGLPLVAESAAQALAAESAVSGSGFCGQALYYNNTPPAAAPRGGSASNAAPNNVARVVLWQGECVNHVCTECATGASRCGSSNTAQTCIQGEWVDNIVMDGTQRTFSVNAVAGVMLACTLMVVVLQFCVCVRIMQAHKAANPPAPEVGTKIEA